MDGSADGVLGGQVAIVTSGAGGIGGGITRRFAAAGATVVVNDIDEVALRAIEEELTDGGGSIVPVPGDLREAAIVEALVVDAGFEAGAGSVDVLVNNVGDYRPKGRFLKTGEADWQALYAINLEHVFRCTHAVAPAMVERGRGSIVNITTVEAHRGIPSNSVYSAFKSAVLGFTRSLAVELGNHGVRVNAVAPDMANTLQTPAAMMLGDRDPALIPCWIPLGRFGEPDDYAEAVLSLAGDQARFITGQTIVVDGGTTAASGWYKRNGRPGWTVLPDVP